MYGKPEYDQMADTFLCEYPENGGICGKWCRDLVRHVTRRHRIPIREYKQLMGIKMNEPLLSQRTIEKLRNALVKRNYFHAIIELGKGTRMKKGENKVQSYARPAQEQPRLKKLWKIREEKKKRKLNYLNQKAKVSKP